MLVASQRTVTNDQSGTPAPASTSRTRNTANMPKLTLVTGNPGKLAEWRRILPPEYELESLDIDLTEIQSLDSREITADKARRAFKQAGKPVIVEDLSAGLDILNGLPGPF